MHKNAHKEVLSHEELVNTFEYDPETGVVSWKDCQRTSRNGKPAGFKSGDKRLYVRVLGKEYQISRLAWYFISGEYPFGVFVDHINGNAMDNRRCNLRIATNQENCRNSGPRVHNKLGIKGVYDTGTGWFRAYIAVDGKSMYLGNFRTIEEAAKCRAEGEQKLFGEFAYTARPQV